MTPGLFAIVTTTVASRDDATSMARALVETRLAACVQIIPIRSVYRWQGAIEDAQEMLLSCKIAAEDFAEVRGAIEKLHGYHVPEIVLIPIAEGADAYLSWLSAETRRA